MEAHVQRRTSNADRQRGKFSWPLAFTFIALIAAAVLAFVFLRLETWPARTAHQANAELARVANSLRDAFVEIGHLQPRITVNNRTFIEKTTPVAELAVLTRQVEVEHEMLHTWAGSTKRVKLQGTFLAKAGFDLRQDVDVTATNTDITIHVPHATILGVEQQRVEVLAMENGFWNRISAADMEAEMAMLPELARQRAAESGLTAEAETSLQQQLAARVHAEKPVRVLFAPEQPKG
jgi:hypothetical protein